MLWAFKEGETASANTNLGNRRHDGVPGIDGDRGTGGGGRNRRGGAYVP